MGGRTPNQSQEWLNEAQTNCDKTNDGMRIGVDTLSNVPELEEDEDEAGHGEAPGEHHEVPVPDKPLVQVETSLRSPGLLKIPESYYVSNIATRVL